MISILKKVNKNHKYNMIKKTDQEIARLIQEVIRWVEVVLISLVATRKMSEILMDWKKTINKDNIDHRDGND